MKKITAVLLVAIMLAACCVTYTSAAFVANSLIELGYPTTNKKETTWTILGWTVGDTEIAKVGYILDGGDVVWVADFAKDGDTKEASSVWFDAELQEIMSTGGYANGLATYFSARIRVAVPIASLAAGAHEVEIMCEYVDGSSANPFRDEVYDFVKKSGASEEATTAEATTAAETEAEVTEEEVTTEAEATEEATTEAEATEEVTTEAATEAATEEVTTEAVTEIETETAPVSEDSAAVTTEAAAQQGGSNVLVPILIIVGVIVVAAVVFIVVKSKKK